MEQASQELGKPQEQFDRIQVSASASRYPESLEDQLLPGGILVLPVMHSLWQVKKKEDRRERKKIYGFQFVPLVMADDA